MVGERQGTRWALARWITSINIPECGLLPYDLFLFFPPFRPIFVFYCPVPSGFVAFHSTVCKLLGCVQAYKFRWVIGESVVIPCKPYYFLAHNPPPQHRLNFRPLPHGQPALRPILGATRTIGLVPRVHSQSPQAHTRPSESTLTHLLLHLGQRSAGRFFFNGTVPKVTVDSSAIIGRTSTDNGNMSPPPPNPCSYRSPLTPSADSMVE